MWDPVPAFAHRGDVDIVVRIWRVDAGWGEDHHSAYPVARAMEARAVMVIVGGSKAPTNTPLP